MFEARETQPHVSTNLVECGVTLQQLDSQEAEVVNPPLYRKWGSYMRGSCKPRSGGRECESKL
jgi:hypothetical protein